MRLALLPLLTAILLPHAAPLAEAEGLACVEWAQEAVSTAYGYDHVVSLHNRCKQRAECDVTTDVNPQAIHVALAADARRDIVTFRGSPARAFSARVRCHD
jgi:hypothetical protein